MDRSHLEGVQCIWTVTLACKIYELLPFVYFHTWILFGAYLQNYTSYGYEILWVNRSHKWGVQCTGTITLAYLIFEFCPERISKTIFTMVMKFCGWIDLIYREMQCIWTVTLACKIYELLPFVYFHTWILFGAYLQNYTSYGYEILWVNRSHKWGVQCTGTITLAYLIFELSPFVYFHTWFLSGAYLQNYTSYGYEILWVDRSHQGGV